MDCLFALQCCCLLSVFVVVALVLLGLVLVLASQADLATQVRLLCLSIRNEEEELVFAPPSQVEFTPLCFD